MGAWVPPLKLKYDDEPSPHYGIYVRDNLEFWLSYKETRLLNGEWVKSSIIHTVTGADVPVGKGLITHTIPILPEEVQDPPWPIMDEWDVRDALLTKSEVDEFMSEIWHNAMDLVLSGIPGIPKRLWIDVTVVNSLPVSTLHCTKENFRATIRSLREAHSHTFNEIPGTCVQLLLVR